MYFSLVYESRLIENHQMWNYDAVSEVVEHSRSLSAKGI